MSWISYHWDLFKKNQKEKSNFNFDSQLTAAAIKKERFPKLSSTWQQDISFMLNKYKVHRGSGWWILQRDTVVPVLPSPERSMALKCAKIGFECIAALCSFVWLKAGPDMFNRFPSASCELHYTSAPFIPILLYLCFVPSRWLFYKSTCIVYAFCGVLFGLCSLSNLTALSCVCWLKVCCPNYGKNNTTMCARMLTL